MPSVGAQLWRTLAYRVRRCCRGEFGGHEEVLRRPICRKVGFVR